MDCAASDMPPEPEPSAETATPRSAAVPGSGRSTVFITPDAKGKKRTVSEAGSVASEATGFKQKRRSAKEAAIDVAIECVKSAKEDYTWAAHYEKRKQNRNFATLLQRLGGHGRKLNEYKHDVQASQVSVQCFQLSQQIENRQNFFEEATWNFPALVVGMKDRDVAIASEAPLPLLASILTAGGEQIAERSTKADAALIKNLAVFLVGGAPSQLTCAFLRNDISLLRETQLSVFLKFTERLLWHVRAFEDVVGVLIRFDAECPELLERFEPVPEGAAAELLPNGYEKSVYTDVCALRIMGLIAHNNIQKRTLGGKFRIAATALSHNLDALSPRFRSLFRPVHGSAVKHGPTLFDSVKAFRNVQSAIEKSTTGKGKVSQHAETLSTAASSSASEVYELIVDVVNEDKELLIQFGSNFLGNVRQDYHDDNDAECVAVANTFAKAWGEAVDVTVPALKVSDLARCVFLERACFQTLPSQLIVNQTGDADSQVNEADDDTPAEFEQVDWLLEVLDVTAACGKTDGALVDALSTKLRQLSGCCHIEYALQRGSRFADTAEKWAAVWSADRAGTIDNDSTPLGALLKNLMATMDVAKLFRRQVLALVREAPDDAVELAAETFSAVSETLPKDTFFVLLLSSEIVNRISTTITELQNTRDTANDGGRALLASGCLERLMQVKSETKIGEEFDMRLGAKVAQITEEFSAAFEAILQKFTEGDAALQKYFEQSDGVREAILAWDFTNHGWALEATATEDRKDVMQTIVNFFGIAQPLASVCENLIKTLDWGTRFRDRMEETVFWHHDARMKHIATAKELMAITCLANVVEHPGKRARSFIMVEKTLSFPKEKWPKILFEKLQISTTDATPPPAAEGRESVETGESQKKRLKRRSL